MDMNPAGAVARPTAVLKTRLFVGSAAVPTNNFLESLSQAHIYLETVIQPRPSIQRETNVQAEGTYRRIVAESHTGAPQEPLAEIRIGSGEGVASVEKRDQPKLF